MKGLYQYHIEGVRKSSKNSACVTEKHTSAPNWKEGMNCEAIGALNPAATTIDEKAMPLPLISSVSVTASS